MPIDAEMPQWLATRATLAWKSNMDNTSSVAGDVMASIIGAGTAAANSDEHVNFMQKWARGFNEAKDSNYDLKQQTAMLAVDQKKAQTDLQLMAVDDQRRGMKEIPEFMRQTSGDPKKILSTSFPWQSQTGAAFGEKAVNAAWMRVNQSKAIDAKMDDTDAKVEIAGINAKAKLDAAQVAATTRENVAKITKGADAGFTPKIIPMAGGAKLIQLGLKRWQYVKGDSKKPLNALQLQTLAGGLDPNDPNKDLIMKGAETMAVRQLTGKTDKTAPAAPQEMGGYKINTVYKGGLKYLGGDPNDESSWQKAQ